MELAETSKTKMLHVSRCPSISLSHLRPALHLTVDPNPELAALHRGTQELHDEGEPLDFLAARLLRLIEVSVAEEDIGFAESEDIGALPPQARFAGCILFVKAIGSHAEAGAMPAKAGIEVLTGPRFPLARE